MTSRIFSNGLGAYKNMAAMEKKISEQEKIFNRSPSSPDFSTLVKKGIESTIQSGHKADNMSVRAAEGKVDLLDLTRAIGEAEESLKTMITIRDKALSAYQSIIQMPI